MIHIYNTLTKQKELLKPIHPKKLGLYVCGITVYDFCHVGHARVYSIFDMVVRYLKSLGFETTYVRNITDIDDKIIKRAELQKEKYEMLTATFIKAMHEDFEALQLLPPDFEPRATEYVSEMIELIQGLIEKGFAYVASNGDVYYDVRKFESYGALSHRHLDDLQAGARVEVVEAKHNPLDFVLWKQAKPGEPHWASPWGEGRPGWHSECCVMSMKLLGKTFDMHGGGPDLKFPHHENERAQSEAFTQQTFVNLWMHIGFVQIDKEKMAKSLGNFITVREFLKQYHFEVLRYFCIASHYRSPVDYAEDNILSAKTALERLYTALRDLESIDKGPSSTAAVSSAVSSLASEFEARFQAAMNDDFNTPLALSVLFDMVREINRKREQAPQEAAALGVVLRRLGNILGILYSDAQSFLQGEHPNLLAPEEIEELIASRNKARVEKNWKEADRIRQTLTDAGIVLEDNQNKTLWRIK